MVVIPLKWIFNATSYFKILIFEIQKHLIFEIQKYYQNEPRFNGVYSRDNLPNVNNNGVTYSDSFGVEHTPKDIRAFIDRSLSITANIFGIQAYDSIMCRDFCIGFIDFMIARKTLTEFTNPFHQIALRKMMI